MSIHSISKISPPAQAYDELTELTDMLDRSSSVIMDVRLSQIERIEKAVQGLLTADPVEDKSTLTLCQGMIISIYSKLITIFNKQVESLESTLKTAPLKRLEQTIDLYNKNFNSFQTSFAASSAKNSPAISNSMFTASFNIGHLTKQIKELARNKMPRLIARQKPINVSNRSIKVPSKLELISRSLESIKDISNTFFIVKNYIDAANELMTIQTQIPIKIGGEEKNIPIGALVYYHLYIIHADESPDIINPDDPLYIKNAFKNQGGYTSTPLNKDRAILRARFDVLIHLLEKTDNDISFKNHLSDLTTVNDLFPEKDKIDLTSINEFTPLKELSDCLEKIKLLKNEKWNLA